MFESLKSRKPRIVDEGGYRKSAVVIPLIERNEQYHVLFEVRSSSLKTQPGEVCFPGGGCEDKESAEQTAVREICEELLIDRDQIELIAPADIFVSPFNMMIYPFIGILKQYKGTYSKDEVQEVFTVPLDFFMNHRPQVWTQQVRIEPAEDFPWDKVPGGEKYPWRRGKYSVNFYEYKRKGKSPRIIWGITAKIMENAASLLREEAGVKESEGDI